MLLHYLILTLLAIAGRLVPHAANFTPIMAVSLYCGLCLSGRRATLMLPPLLGLLIGDAVLGFYDLALMGFVYMGLILPVFVGRLITRIPAWPGLIGLSLGSGFIFFLISNFGVWVVSPTYPRTWAGLGECYGLALPFLRNTLIGNLVWTGILFGPLKHCLSAWRLIPLSDKRE